MHSKDIVHGHLAAYVVVVAQLLEMNATVLICSCCCRRSVLVGKQGHQCKISDVGRYQLDVESNAAGGTYVCGTGCCVFLTRVHAARRLLTLIIAAAPISYTLLYVLTHCI